MSFVSGSCLLRVFLIFTISAVFLIVVCAAAFWVGRSQFAIVVYQNQSVVHCDPQRPEICIFKGLPFTMVYFALPIISLVVGARYYQKTNEVYKIVGYLVLAATPLYLITYFYPFLGYLYSHYLKHSLLGSQTDCQYHQVTNDYSVGCIKEFVSLLIIGLVILLIIPFILLLHNRIKKRGMMESISSNV